MERYGRRSAGEGRASFAFCRDPLAIVQKRTGRETGLEAVKILRGKPVNPGGAGDIGMCSGSRDVWKTELADLSGGTKEGDQNDRLVSRLHLSSQHPNSANPLRSQAGCPRLEEA